MAVGKLCEDSKLDNFGKQIANEPRVRLARKPHLDMVLMGESGREVVNKPVTQSARNRGLRLDLDRAVGAREVTLVALELTGYAASGRVGRHLLHEVHESSDEGAVDALGRDVVLVAVGVDHGA